MKQVISYSLWGTDPKYLQGALRNVELASWLYPGWIVRFYIDSESVPADYIESLQKLHNVEVVCLKASEEPHWAMFWRFYAAEDADVVIFRDADSRLTMREAVSVEEWRRGTYSFHIMRDHPQHGTPICGGMWGVRFRKAEDIRSKIDKYYAAGLTKTALFGIDQDFLTHSVWPDAKDDCYVNDEFFANRPFTLPRNPIHFIGQAYNADGSAIHVGK